MKRTLSTFTACYALLALISSPCWAKPGYRVEDPYALPRWEIGVMGGLVSMPSYRGSDENNLYAFPLPYLYYRGEFLRADRESVAGRFLRTRHFELDLSVFVAIHDDDDRREGMPELLPLMFEAGPALKYYFFRKGETPRSLYVEIPFRWAIAAEWDEDRESSPLDLDRAGLSSRINLYYEDDRLFDSRRLSFIGGAAVAFGNDELNAYYYDVLPSQATATRPAHETGDWGYGGFSLSGNLLARLTPRLALRLYGRWDNTDGAVFEDSPLVSTSNNFTAGAFLMVRLFQSDSAAID